MLMSVVLSKAHTNNCDFLRNLDSVGLEKLNAADQLYSGA